MIPSQHRKWSVLRIRWHVTNLLARRWSVNCSSLGSLMLRKSPGSVPCCDRRGASEFSDWKNARFVWVCVYWDEDDVPLSSHIQITYLVKFKGDFEELKAQRWYRLMKGPHEDLWLRSLRERKKHEMKMNASVSQKEDDMLGGREGHFSLLHVCLVVFSYLWFTWCHVGHRLKDGGDELTHVLKLGLWQIEYLIACIKIKVPRAMC